MDLLIQGASNRIVVFKDGHFADVDIEEGLAMKKSLPETVQRVTRLLAR